MELSTKQLSPQQLDAMEFLASHLPQSDLDTYDTSLFLQFVDHALALRASAPWCAALDEEIFYHYVLFPRVNDEDLSFHREIFRDALWERICSLSTTKQMILEVNRWCHENASYEMQDDRTASPLTVYRSGSGRCGEESGFLVSALRSVGIPARQVYSPRWAHCDDNHAWVEALCDGRWRFLGACEPEPVLDRGWFNSPASRALLVHSRLFGEGSHPLHGDTICTEGCIRWYNQTSRYALTKRRTIRVSLNGQPAVGAAVCIQVLNEASFHTIATLTTDARGEASIELGLGDVHIFASLGDNFAECDCAAGEDAALSLAVFHTDTQWHTADYRAPQDAPVNPSPLSHEQKVDRAEALSRGRALREKRIAAMQAGEHGDFSRLAAARSNAEEILRFLRRSEDPMRRAMVGTLTDKDLRDVTETVLSSHLAHRAPQGDIPDDVYFPYVLCPRIELEKLTPWREELSKLPPVRPDEIHGYLTAQLCVSDENTYKNLLWTPEQALRAKRCDGRSLRVLCVAVLRAQGVPARLRKTDGAPEYWQNGAWRSIYPEEQGTLVLTSGTKPLYRQNFSLSRWDGGWQLLQLDDNCWQDGRLELSVPVGQYRIVTSVRMPNGNQFAAQRTVSIQRGKQTETELFFRSYELSDLLRCQELPPMRAAALEGDRIENICRTNDRPTVLFWLEEGGEPTEHVLNELMAEREAWDALPVNLLFLLRGAECLRQQTLAKAVAALPGVRVLLDDWSYDLEQTARHLTCDPDAPPLAVVCDREGRAVYGTSGYSVGSVSLVRKIAEHLLIEY